MVPTVTVPNKSIPSIDYAEVAIASVPYISTVATGKYSHEVPMSSLVDTFTGSTDEVNTYAVSTYLQDSVTEELGGYQDHEIEQIGTSLYISKGNISKYRAIDTVAGGTTAIGNNIASDTADYLVEVDGTFFSMTDGLHTTNSGDPFYWKYLHFDVAPVSTVQAQIYVNPNASSDINIKVNAIVSDTDFKVPL